MRSGLLELCFVILAVIGIHVERLLHSGSIEGRISPAKASPDVIAVRGIDSVKISPGNGHFGMELQPGDWKLIFAVNDLNGSLLEKKVRLLEGRSLNHGEIRLAR